MSFKDSIFYRVFSAVLGFYAALLVLVLGIGLVGGLLYLLGIIS